MITGFQATMTTDDGGTGAAPGAAQTSFTGLVTITFPGLTVPGFDATELNQFDGGNADQYERELPAGTKKLAKITGRLKYTKANYQRLQGLAGVRSHVWVFTTPDDLTTPGTPVKLVATLVGWLSMIGDLEFEKGTPAHIPFEITIEKKPTSYV
jgi:hypothetical protein